MNQIFPKEIVNNTIEVHSFKNRISSNIIYNILIISIIISCIVLPFVYLDIYTSAQGIIKSDIETNQISSYYSGKIKEIFIKENQTILKGDTLLIVDNAVVMSRLKLLSNQLAEVKSFVQDLNYLSNEKKATKDSLKSILYQKRYIQYSKKTHLLQTRFLKFKNDFIRQEKLLNKDVISKVEFEKSQFNLNSSLSELNYYKTSQYNQWQSELTQQSNKLQELESILLQYKKERNNHFIVAPISGTIQNLIGLEVGNFITKGSPLAEISPNTKLIAECFLKPADIGLLKPKTHVKIQVDAFNYNQWGTAKGKIIYISNDILVVNNNRMFKVICSIDQKRLQLKNGFQGELKKGMTINVRFFIAKRSLYNLLYDSIDDWYNPTKNNKQ